MSLLLAAGLCSSAMAQVADTEHNRALQRESNVANVVHGILNYARWPQTPRPLNLCIVAPTEYADLLWQQPKMSSAYQIHVKRLLVDNPKLESECQAIYIGVMEPQQRRLLFSQLIGKPVLSISESSQGCNEGSLFCLNIRDEHVGFKVNLDAVARSGVRIHPNVLQLGQRAGSQP
ncbi:YfiR family protein [Pseudomonas sp. 5P_3.1_Bac2]|nr:YfiR family protein [Pseudomonas sp. 5P_3.1_Bac2]MCU1717531.1 YfiR family protein [Pseudomonas sp. 5P_3.1_Bac2]